MDNVTHSLVGLAFGEAVALQTRKKRVPIWIASALANNLPDLDVALTSTLFRGDKAGYLLHHRGHSHTFLLAPLLSGFLLGILWLFWRNKKDIPWKPVIFVSLLGIPLHIFADFWNSYGVHPFWPFYNEWVYGDLVFIVEPWIWALLIPPLFFRASSKWGKLILLSFVPLILTIAWVHSAVNWQAAALLTAAFVLSFLGQKALPGPRARIGVGIAGLAAVLVSLGVISHRVKSSVASNGNAEEEIAATPFPANPLCWNVISAGFAGNDYVATNAVVAAFPNLVAAKDCPGMFEDSFTAPFIKDLPPTTEARKVIGVFRAPRAELLTIAADCHANALLRFTRLPFWKKVEDGWLLGDLRYDRGDGLGFTEEVFPAARARDNCPRLVPPWIGRFHPERAEPKG
jgi:inner membrane protein